MNTNETCPKCGGELQRMGAEKCCDYEVVRRIIEGEMESTQKNYVYRIWVIAQIKIRVDRNRIYNNALEHKCTTDSFVENIHRGAQIVFLDAMRAHKERFIVRRDGRVTRR